MLQIILNDVYYNPALANKQKINYLSHVETTQYKLSV